MTYIMPVLRGFENGTYEATEANGWQQLLGSPNMPSMVSVWRDSLERELVIITPRLETNSCIYLQLITPLDDHVLNVKIDIITVNDDIEPSMTATVNLGLAQLAELDNYIE